jgi:hypothetical protein
MQRPEHYRHCEPTVEQDVANQADLPAYHVESHVKGVAQCQLPQPVAVGALVQALPDAVFPVLLVAGTQQPEIHRDCGVPQAKDQREAAEAPMVAVVIVVKDAGQKLDALAAVPLVQGVVQDKHPGVVFEHKPQPRYDF